MRRPGFFVSASDRSVWPETADETVAVSRVQQPHRRDRSFMIPCPPLDQQAGFPGGDVEQGGIIRLSGHGTDRVFGL